MIRILNITGGLTCGGVEATVMNYYRHTDRSKVQFDFFLNGKEGCIDKDYYEDEAISLGARIFRLSGFKKHPFRYLADFKQIFRNNEDIKIVHIHDYYSLRASVYALLATLCGVKTRIVCSSCDVRAFCGKTHLFFRPLLRMVSTHWMTCSIDAGLSLFGERSENKLLFMRNARDLDAYSYNLAARQLTRQQLNLGSRYTMINVGRLAEQKNQIFMIEAFALALRHNPDMILLIAGEGELQAQLESKASELGIADSIRFLGLCDNVPELLQAADLFILPSLFEGLPGVAIEAQIAGLPCLISDKVSLECKITDAVEILPIDNGPQIWADRIIAHIGTQRIDTTEAIRRAGYDIKQAANDLQEFYLRCIDYS